MDSPTRDGVARSAAAADDLLPAIVSGAPHCVLVGRPDGSILHANAAACAALGRTEDELRRIGRHGLLVLDGQAVELLSCRDRAGQVEGEVVFRRGDGAVMPSRIVSAIVRLPDGTSATYTVFAPPASRGGTAGAPGPSGGAGQREALLAAILDGTADGILVVGDTGAVLQTNRRFQRLWRIPADLLAGGCDEDLLRYVTGQLADPEEFRREVERLYGSPDPSLDHVLLADGRTFERYSAPFPHDGPRARLWSFRDVTDRVRAEEAARRNHRFFETVIDTALDGYWVAGPDGAIREVNDAVCEMLGYTRRELLGMRIRDIEAMESPADVEARFQRIRTTGRDRFETRHRRKDGRLIDVEMSLRRLDLEDCPVVGFSRDLTERKRMQERMALSARLAGMGTLVAGVAHEVNNPLAAVLSSDGFALECVRALSGQVEEGDAPTMENVGRTLRDVAEALEDAQSAGQRIAQIVRSMAALANPHPTLSRTRLADVVSAAVRWLPAFVEKAVDLEVDVDGAPTVLAAPGQLEQLVVNLVGNAARSVRRGRRGLVRIRAFLPVPGLARIEVTDDGVGIDPAILPRIFDPFFTTRPSGEGHGAGLGLAVSHAIAEAHGGTLGVESVPGMGATFRLDLPAVADGPDGTGPAAGDRAAEP